METLIIFYAKFTIEQITAESLLCFHTFYVFPDLACALVIDEMFLP